MITLNSRSIVTVHRGSGSHFDGFARGVAYLQDEATFFVDGVGAPFRSINRESR